MENKRSYATITRLVVLIVVAMFSWGVGYYLGFWTGVADTGSGYSVRDSNHAAFFEGLGVGIVLFVFLLVVLLWHSHQSGVRASCDELTYRVDKLQRELLDLRAATERKASDASV